VEIEGLGRLILDMDLEGNLSLGLQIDNEFMAELNARFDKSAATLENAEHVGKTSAELYDLWDEEYPDDLVERS
jgi:hypothetical protein